MEENTTENNIENKPENLNTSPAPKNNQSQIAGAIIIAGIIIAGAILLKGGTAPVAGNAFSNIVLSKVSEKDRVLGDSKAKVALILYEDFQCPFCGVINGSEAHSSLVQSLKQRDPSWAPFMPEVKNNYINNGKVKLVYRDWAFLGPESMKSAEAGWCANDQGKFWEYHDYLYNHQNGENQGAFVDANLKSFAKTLALNATEFDTCLDGGKYAQVVADSRTEGTTAGVSGTPKGFILKNGKIVATIEGAESWTTVKTKIDSALK
jgi:protein-disulfide isomerase